MSHTHKCVCCHLEYTPASTASMSAQDCPRCGCTDEEAKAIVRGEKPKRTWKLFVRDVKFTIKQIRDGYARGECRPLWRVAVAFAFYPIHLVMRYLYAATTWAVYDRQDAKQFLDWND